MGNTSQHTIERLFNDNNKPELGCFGRRRSLLLLKPLTQLLHSPESLLHQCALMFDIAHTTLLR